jgi:hypothetical protein
MDVSGGKNDGKGLGQITQTHISPPTISHKPVI